MRFGRNRAVREAVLSRFFAFLSEKTAIFRGRVASVRATGWNKFTILDWDKALLRHGFAVTPFLAREVGARGDFGEGRGGGRSGMLARGEVGEPAEGGGEKS